MSSEALRILVPLEDPATEKNLVRFALTLAATRKGQLHLAHVLADATAPVDGVADHLRELAALAHDHGVDCQYHLSTNPSVTDGIAQLAAAESCNMLLMGWYHQVERSAITQAANRSLAKDIGLDTLIFLDRGFESVRRVVVPTGGGSHSLMGLQIGYELALHLDVGMEVLRVARDTRCADDPLLQRFCAQVEQETRLEMGLLNVEAPIHILPSPHIVEPIAQRIQRGDLVILGASNGWKLDGYLAGPIPDRLANCIPGSVLLVRAQGAGSPALNDVFWERTIRLGLEATDKAAAITYLIDALIDEQQIPVDTRSQVLAAAIERESKGTTWMGHGTAIPHAPIPELPGIIGALGISPAGIRYDSGAEHMAHFIFLMLTPRQNYRIYIPVLAQVAALMRGQDTAADLLACQTPADVARYLRRHTKRNERTPA